MSLPYSSACAENRAPILAILQQELPSHGVLLEIGSGTGQHSVYFAPQFPQLSWQASDVAENLPTIRAWQAKYPAANLLAPLQLDVRQPWPVLEVDAVYSANTCHIMHWPAVQALFQGVGRILKAGGVFCLYGPFAQDGQMAASNFAFDAQLRERDPGMGVRNQRDLQALAEVAGLYLSADHPMPRDNQILVWRRLC